MLDDLILAYRSRFYDWDFKEIKELCSKNRVILLWLSAFVLSAVSITVYCVYAKSVPFMFALLTMELALGIWADRYTVKQYQRILSGKRDHLAEVASLLRTAVPGENLYHAEQIEEMIERLTNRIETRIPFRNLRSGLSGFGKAIVLPAATYIAGAYSARISQAEFQTVLTWGILIVLILGLADAAIRIVTQALRKITCRDYDAAVAFREDLLDIRLLFFTAGAKRGESRETPGP